MYAAGREGDDSWFTTGLAWTLLAAGLVLLLIPEPATSGAGLLLLMAGVVVWVVAKLW